MIPINTSYPNPNYYSISSRVGHQLFRQSLRSPSPIVYSTWSWPNHITAQGRAQRSQLVSYHPSRTIYTSCGHCRWQGSNAVYSSQGFGEIIGGTHGGCMLHSTQLPSYSSGGYHHGNGHFDRNSWINMYNHYRFHPHGEPEYRHGLYYGSNPVTTNVTRQPSSAFIHPSSIMPTPVGDNAMNFRLDALPPLIRPDTVDDDEAHHYFDSFVQERQELDDKPVSTTGEISPQAVQHSNYNPYCHCYRCTNMPFYDESSDQSETESASTYATGDGWNSPISPLYVSVEAVDSNNWRNNQRSECFGNCQYYAFSRTTSRPPMYWQEPRQDFRSLQQGHYGIRYPVLVPPQFYQRSMGEYGPNPKVLCQQQNYIGYQYVGGQFVQMLPYQNNATTAEQHSTNYSTPLHLEIPEVSFIQISTNGLMLEKPIQQSCQKQTLSYVEDWDANQMLLKICDDSPNPRNSVPEIWEQEYEHLLNYDGTGMPASPRVSRYFPTVPVEHAETGNLTATVPASTSPEISNRKVTSLPCVTVHQRSPVSVHQPKHILQQLPHLQQQVRPELVAGGMMPHVNNEVSPTSFMGDSIGRMVNERLDFEEVNDHRSTSFTSFRNYYDTHNQPDDVAGNSSMGMQTTQNGNVGGGAPSSTTMQGSLPSQQQQSGVGFSGSQQNGRRRESDSDVSNITLRTLLETPYSPRTRNERNPELEEYQRMLAEEELQKKLDALKAKENSGNKDNNGNFHG